MSESRRIGLRIVIVGVMLFAGCMVAPSACPRMDLASVATAAAHAADDPEFVYPAADRERDSDVKAVFERNGEVTVVFGDEDQPNPILDRFYKLFRWRRWKRLMDVETFIVGRGAPGVKPTIFFSGTFARDQTWYVSIARHETAAIPVADFPHDGARPVIAIDTWNHMFGPMNNNADMTCVTCSAYPVYEGSRKEVEALFGTYYETVWWRPWAVIAGFFLVGILFPLPKRTPSPEGRGRG